MFNMRYAGAAGHQQILDVGNKLSYPLNPGGACIGIARTALGQLLNNRFDAFEQSLAAATQLAIEDLKYSELKSYAQGKTRKSTKLYEYLQSSLPLIENITANQDPDKFPGLYDEDSNDSIDEQVLNHLTYQKIVISDKIKFLSYYDSEGLSLSIQRLMQILQCAQCQLSFILEAKGHAMGIGWDRDKWLLIDANKFPVKRSASVKEIVDFIFEAFTFPEHDKADGLAITFELHVRACDQLQVEGMLLPWKVREYDGRLGRSNKLSSSELSDLFCQARYSLDEELLLETIKNPRLDKEKVLARFESPLLYWACYHNKIKLVMFVLSRKMDDVNVTFKEATPLHVAAENGYKEIVSLLLAQPAIDIDRKCNGKTAMELALEQSHNQIADLINEHAKSRNVGNDRKKLKIQ